MSFINGFNDTAGGGRRLGNGGHSSAPGGGRLSGGGSMFGALVKKQFMELSTLFSFGKRRSKRGSAGGALLTLGLYILIGVSLGASMLLLAESMGLEILNKGEDWKFFAVLDTMGLLLATLITMFNADLTLFRAKDNEILLSMPIPPGFILLARMLPLYFISLIFTASVVVPAIVVYRSSVGLGILGVLLNVLILLVLGFLALALSSVMGWLISLINSKVKNNALVSMILTVAFLGAYFYFYFQINKFSEALVNGSSQLAENIKKFCPPMYWVGSAHTGSVTGVLLGALSIAVVFGVIYFALSKTFRGVVINASKGGSTKVMGGSELKSGKPEQVLLKKEFRRFTTSTSYMMNCGLGTIFMLIASVFAIIKRSTLVDLVNQVSAGLADFENFIPGIIAILIFFLVSTCYYTMPSISLEGKTIWILQSLPLDPMKIFMSKIKMEYILCVPGILVLTTVLSVILKQSILSWAVSIISALAYTTFTAFFGLWINLLRPNLDWTNEAYPIKQGLNPLICLFGEWLLALVLGGIYFLIFLFVPAEGYLMLVSLVLLLVSFLIYRWLLRGGRARFEAL